MEIRHPIEDIKDFAIEVRASILRQCHGLLRKLESSRFRWTEICLAMSTLAAGGILGALQSGTTKNSDYWWLFYTILPALFVTSFTSYWILRRTLNIEPASISHDIQRILPDPDKPDSVVPPAYIHALTGDWAFTSYTNSSKKHASGMLTFAFKHGRLIISGIINGEQNTQIGIVKSLSTDYNPDNKYLMVIYECSAFNDDNTIDNSNCILSGLVFIENDDGISIKGNWFHLNCPTISGSALLKRNV